MDCSLSGSSIHGILQARILEWVAYPFSTGSSRPGIEPGSPVLQVDSLPAELPGSPWSGWTTIYRPIRLSKYILVGNYELLSVQFSSVTQLSLTLCDPMNHSMPGLPVHHQLPGSTQTHVCCVGDAIQPSHPLSSPSPPALNPSQHQGLFEAASSQMLVYK